MTVSLVVRAVSCVAMAWIVLAVPGLRADDLSRGVGVVRVRVPEEGTTRTVDLYTESHALVIGASRYTNGWNPLPGVAADVEAVAAALRQHGFATEVVLDPTRATFDQALRRFVASHGASNARLLVYFAGHGQTLTTDDGRQLGYIVPVDAPRSEDKAAFKQAAVSMNEIENYALQIEAKHAMFVFDSCFSGSIFESEMRGGAPPIITHKTTQPVREFITAGTADQKVPDRSIFRDQFVAALNGDADRNGDGYVTGNELGEFVRETVTNYSNGSQTPRFGLIRNPKLDKGDLVFPIPGWQAPPTAAASDSKPPAVDSSRAEIDYWRSIENSDKPEPFREYLRRYPKGFFVAVAQAKLKPPQPALDPTKPANEARPDAGTEQVPSIVFSVTDAELRSIVNEYSLALPAIGIRVVREAASARYAVTLSQANRKVAPTEVNGVPMRSCTSSIRGTITSGGGEPLSLETSPVMKARLSEAAACNESLRTGVSSVMDQIKQIIRKAEQTR